MNGIYIFYIIISIIECFLLCDLCIRYSKEIKRWMEQFRQKRRIDKKRKELRKMKRLSKNRLLFLWQKYKYRWKRAWERLKYSGIKGYIGEQMKLHAFQIISKKPSERRMKYALKLLKRANKLLNIEPLVKDRVHPYEADEIENDIDCE